GVRGRRWRPRAPACAGRGWGGWGGGGGVRGGKGGGRGGARGAAPPPPLIFRAGVSVSSPAVTSCTAPVASLTRKSDADPIGSVSTPPVSSTRTFDTGAWPSSVPGK